MTRNYKKIVETLNRLRKYLHDDGGDMELVNFDEKNGVLDIKICGACIGCDLVKDTFDNGIGKIIKKKHKFVKDINFNS